MLPSLSIFILDYKFKRIIRVLPIFITIISTYILTYEYMNLKRIMCNMTVTYITVFQDEKPFKKYNPFIFKQYADNIIGLYRNRKASSFS